MERIKAREISLVMSKYGYKWWVGRYCVLGIRVVKKKSGEEDLGRYPGVKNVK